MFNRLRQNYIAIDLGTANTLIYKHNEGIIFNEPTVIAIKKANYSKKVLAIGLKAREMIGKNHKDIEVIEPLRDGAIADFEMTALFISHLIAHIKCNSYFFKPKIVISIPHGLTQVERGAVKEAGMKAGAKKVYLIEDPFSAAIGSDISITDTKGHMLIDIGSGMFEISVISLGGLVISKAIKCAGNKLDLVIQNYIKQKYNLLISNKVAENIKIQIGRAIPSSENEKKIVDISGRNLITGMLIHFNINDEEIYKAIKDDLDEMIKTTKEVIATIPPQFASDILDNGIILTGGGALLKDIDKFFQSELNILTYVSNEPLLAVVKGAGKVLFLKDKNSLMLSDIIL